MSSWSNEKRLQAALNTLSTFTLRSVPFLNRELEYSFSHDWSKDPFSLGAYSYISVGGTDIVKRLSRPFEQTIYFTGEACVSGSHRGTVEGAFSSGRRVAKQLLL